MIVLVMQKEGNDICIRMLTLVFGFTFVNQF
jgi:hypothetical protein